MLVNQKGDSKGPDGSNLPRSANQSVHFAYILEKAETPRELWRSFRPQRTGESHLTPNSPDSASILSVRTGLRGDALDNRHRRLRRNDTRQLKSGARVEAPILIGGPLAPCPC
jgi:hypothetical protein